MHSSLWVNVKDLCRWGNGRGLRLKRGAGIHNGGSVPDMGMRFLICELLDHSKGARLLGFVIGRDNLHEGAGLYSCWTLMLDSRGRIHRPCVMILPNQIGIAPFSRVLWIRLPLFLVNYLIFRRVVLWVILKPASARYLIDSKTIVLALCLTWQSCLRVIVAYKDLWIPH